MTITTSRTERGEHAGGVPTDAEVERALRRAWFPVARLSDLDTPRAATLLGERLAVFLTEAGEPAVVSGTCPHRGGALADGFVRGDSIVCPYHAWEWHGGDGTCTRIPSLPEGGVIPPRAVVATYPAVSRWGLVWTCLEEPAVELPSPTLLEGVEWTWEVGPPLPVSAGIRSATENFRDVAHFPFVHEATMGKLPHEVEPLDVSRDGTVVRLRRRYDASGGREESMYHDGMLWEYENISPAFVCLIFDHGPEQGTRVLLNAPSPHTAPTSPGPNGRQTCTIYWIEGVVDFRGATLEELVAGEHEVYLEDNPILDGLEPSEPPLDPTAQVHSPSDLYNLEYRRAFTEFVRSASESPRSEPR